MASHPEAVYIYTSATYDKKKRKQFETAFGVFTYRDVPKAAYPMGIRIEMEGDYPFLSPGRKKRCVISSTPYPCCKFRAFEALLFNDLRIDRDTFRQLDEKLMQYAALYQTTNHKRLIQYVRRKT